MFYQSLPKSGAIMLDRRKFLAIAGGLVAAGVLPRSALALAGPHTIKQGAYDLTIVSDGTLMLPLSIVTSDAPAEMIKTLLGAQVQGDKAEFQVNVVLLRSGSEVILIDTGAGAGPGAQPTAGKLAESLKAAGTDAASVTKVIFTHAHPDHLWGSTADGAIVFPKASFHMAENEYNFWAAPDLPSKMPKEMEGMVKGTQGQLGAIKEKMAMFKPGDEVVPGLMAIDTAGHTPGHVSFEMTGGDGLIITGDAITNAAVFFAHPEWKFGFDADGAAAGANRKKLLDMASAGKKLMVGYHWPYPGVGRAEAKDGAFVYVPAA
jgi:glyoxylase-like metal-dependent hydrolase (beta-lactamase superfamily II)